MPQCYLTAETIEKTDEEGNKTEIECYAAVATDNDNQEDVLFKYRLVEKTGEDKMPNLHIYVGEDEYVFSSKSYIKDGAPIEHINEDKTVKTTTTTYTQIYTVIITKSSDEKYVKEFSTEGTTSTALSSETIKITENSEAINGGNQ